MRGARRSQRHLEAEVDLLAAGLRLDAEREDERRARLGGEVEVEADRLVLDPRLLCDRLEDERAAEVAQRVGLPLPDQLVQARAVSGVAECYQRASRREQ